MLCTFFPPPGSIFDRVGKVLELNVDSRSPWQRGEPLGLHQVVVHLLGVSLQQRCLLAACRPLRHQLVHTDAHCSGVQHQVGGAVGILKDQVRNIRIV